MGNVIQKFKLSTNRQVQTIMMPSSCRVLPTVGIERGDLQIESLSIWAIVNTVQKINVDRSFLVVSAEDAVIPKNMAHDYRFLGTIQLAPGHYGYHVFEEVKSSLV